MTQKAVSCPCEQASKCRERRELAVNIVLDERVCTANEVKALINDNLGKWATRKSIEFLRYEKCEKISALKNPKGKQIQFLNQGRLFFRKDAQEKEIQLKILSLLTNFQYRILKTVQKYNKYIYYFSSYDIRKILPAPGFQVSYTLNRLCDLGLVSKVKQGNTNFYTEPANVPKLKRESEKILVEDYTEYLIAKRVHELIMYLYPLDLITEFRGALRPRSKKVLEKTGGMTFDIFYQFEKKVTKKCFLAVDIYSRLPLNGYGVFSLINKIKWAKPQSSVCLDDKTYGMILFRNATPEAFEIAKKNGIHLVNISRISIDYESVRRQAESKLKTAQTKV